MEIRYERLIVGTYHRDRPSDGAYCGQQANHLAIPIVQRVRSHHQEDCVRLPITLSLLFDISGRTISRRTANYHLGQGHQELMVQLQFPASAREHIVSLLFYANGHARPHTPLKTCDFNTSSFRPGDPYHSKSTGRRTDSGIGQKNS